MRTALLNWSMVVAKSVCVTLLVLMEVGNVAAQTREFNSTGGTSATNGLHFYIDNTSKIQVRRLDNTGQVYSPTVTPPNNALDNGVFLRANNVVYGPSHTVTTFNPTPYNTATIGVTSPPNPSSNGVQQSVTNVLGVTAGPQVTINWKYTTPLNFMTAEVSLVIPAGYTVSAANPVRYYHVFDTYLGGSDQGCGVNVAGPPRIVGTYSGLTSGPSCPTSTSLPTSGTVVESFRERTGTFTRYCAAAWNNFFQNASTCSVLKAGQMGNTITTTLQDTGIGIEYDFTATGTYTFSYDFVIGATTVPPYDHIEIRHDGGATLCPENIVVVACTNTGANCTPVSTGTITGNVAFTTAAPGVTFSPSGFSVGGSGTSANMVMQATAASAGTYTLVATGLNVAPLNGTKCTDMTGMVATSCTFVIANSACVANFECVETTQAYSNRLVAGNRNPLYTKLVNTDFTFDVVALDSAANIATGFVGNVDVILYDDSANPVCTAATAIPGGAQSFAFIAADNGRRTIASSFNLPNAYKDLRCRVTATGVTPAVTACSSDAFTVRPQEMTAISSVTANADEGSGALALPIIKAGANFGLTATTGVVGYDGTPQVNTSLLNWPSVPSAVGSIAGAFSAANAATGAASGAAFSYSEVGYFRFSPLGVIDTTFANGSSDIANGDCNANASNTLDSNKYGCYFGNLTDSAYFGRFVPNHFTVSSSAMTKGCDANGFTYMDQPFSLDSLIEAKNAAGGRTYNYHGAYAKASFALEAENSNDATPLGSRFSATSANGTWNLGVFNFNANSAQFSRLATADGPYEALDIGVTVSDPEGSLLSDRNMQQNTVSCTASSPGATDGNCTARRLTPLVPGPFLMRHGRVRLANVYGSELLALPIPMFIEYWAGTPSVNNFIGWTKNTMDTSCTVPVASNFALAFKVVGTPNLVACETALSVLPLKLSAPGAGNNGWVDVTLSLGTSAVGTQCVAVGGVGPAETAMNKPWLQFNWDGTGVKNPKARAHFGVYKKSPRVIYTREVH